MRYLPLVILLMVAALVATVTGCQGEARYDARLTAADSLLTSNPDSALALVEALAPADLATLGDRAYRDLLVTQARYKCYITATSDSDINRALAYYRAHDSEQEKLTRAYIYKGAVMEELGHPDSAMLYYKHAEATAAPDDYFNLGYVNIRIGFLYQSFYANDSAILTRMRRATQYLLISEDTNMLITAIGAQGACLYDSNKDSAKVYLENAVSLAWAINSPKRFKYQSKLAGVCFYQQDYFKAKALAVDIIKNGRDVCDENQYYYYAARSFVKLSCIDSAYIVKSMIPAPINAVDSMNHYRLEAELAEAEHRYNEYTTYISNYKDINDRILTSSLKTNLVQTELKWDADRDTAQAELHLLHFEIALLLVIPLLILLAYLTTKQIYRKRIRHYRRDLELSRNELEKTIRYYESEIEKRQSIIDSHQPLPISKIKVSEVFPVENNNQKILQDRVSEVVRYRLAAIRELYYDIRVKPSSASKSEKKQPALPLMSMIKDMNDQKKLYQITPKHTFWEKLSKSVEGEYPGITIYLEKKCSDLSLRELHLFWLLCAKISPQLIKLCMNYSNTATVSNNKRKLIKDRLGLDMKFEKFLQLFLAGKLD